MSRLTITLSEARYRALKEASAQRRADLLHVTGDKALQRGAGMQARVVSPQSFVDGR